MLLKGCILFKKFSSHISIVTLIYFSLTSVAAFAQQRVVEESLVYDDPTVAKPGRWLFGVGVDYYNYSSRTQFTNNSGQTYNSDTKFSQPGASAWIGYGDFTLLSSYRQGSGTTNFPGNTGYTTDQKEFDLSLRYLIKPLGAKYFVPYVLAGYTRLEVKDTISPSQAITTTTYNAPGIGVGGIIPITEKYGLRADYRRYKGTSSSQSNDPADNFNPWTQFVKITATAYYNITDNINLQLGARTQYSVTVPLSTTTGGYLSLGFTF